MMKEKIAHIIGNGISRKGYDLAKLKNKGLIFGCNALYRDYKPDYILPDYLVAIDHDMIQEIRNSDFPKERFIEPNENEKWEPVELHWGRSSDSNWNPQRPRSNAGINAILEAIKFKVEELYIFGFDSLIVNQDIALSNCYENTDCYDPTKRANIQDTRNRLKYLGWIIEKNPDVMFKFCFPKEMTVYKPEASNTKLYTFDDVNSLLESENNVY